MEKKPFLIIHSDDSVLIALRDLKEGERLQVNEKAIQILSDIPAGHKVASRAIPKGDNVIKYGYPIGHAIDPIEEGEWVHSHNLKTNLEGTLDYKYEPDATRVKPGSSDKTFLGFPRKNGDVGIRNEIWIINTVGCINKTAENLARMANDELKHAKIDGVFHFPHPFGCSQLGDDLTYTQKLLGHLVKHPNAGGVLVIGLGCENNYVNSFKDVLGDYDEKVE